MPKKYTKPLLLVAAVAVGVLALACSKKDPEPAKHSEPVAFKSESPIPVSLTLQKADGQIGRASPITSNYRPQVRFDLVPEEVSCVVGLPASMPSLEPGQTTSASLVCNAEIRVDASKPEFAVLEGGRQVGRGTVQLP